MIGTANSTIPALYCQTSARGLLVTFLHAGPARRPAADRSLDDGAAAPVLFVRLGRPQMNDAFIDLLGSHAAPVVDVAKEQFQRTERIAQAATRSL
jgi:hypothetical protein